MFLVIPALITGGAGLLGGFFGAQSANDINKQNIALAREQMGFQAGQTAKQMEFQERMSSTAHQREVQDLIAAGLNPMLAVAKGSAGASSPPGAAATGQTAHVTRSPWEAWQSALGVVSQLLDIKQKAADVKKTEVDTVKSTREGDLAGYQGMRIQRLIDGEVDLLAARGDVSRAEAERLRTITPLLAREIEARIRADIGSAKAHEAQARLTEKDIQYYIPFAKYLPNFMPLTRGIGRGPVKPIPGPVKAPIGFR